MRAALGHLILCAAAAALPAFVPGALWDRATGPLAEADADAGRNFPGWPTSFEGRALREIPPTDLDARFARDLPGRVRRFTDGEREIVLRWSPLPTRLVHPSAVCFRAQGWEIEPRPLHLDAAGGAWGSFLATRGEERLLVRERVVDLAGRSWPEPTAWWWASVLGRTSGAAWAWTVAERAPRGEAAR